MRAIALEVLHYLKRAASRSTAQRIAILARAGYLPHMPFRRFFDRGAKDASPKADPAAPDDARTSRRDAEADEAESAEENLDEHDEPIGRTRARAVMPTGASTGSKRAEALYGAADAIGPTHFVAGDRLPRRRCRRQRVPRLHDGAGLGGPRLRGAERHARGRRRHRGGKRLGACRAFARWRLPSACAASSRAPIVCSSSRRAPKRWPRPCASRERIRRATWSSAAAISAGSTGAPMTRPAFPRARRRAFRRVAYDDVAALEAAVSDGGSAARRDRHRAGRSSGCRPREWIARARELATAAGAVLIFDEIKTGFRLHTGGYQAYADVMPDLVGVRQGDGERLSAVGRRR